MANEHIKQIMDSFDVRERHTISSGTGEPKTNVIQRKAEFHARQSDPDIPLAPILTQSRAFIEGQILEATPGEHKSNVKFEKESGIKIKSAS